ncbi:hypothetical protein CDEN61S_03928 [Castellaniella denitrificans]
MPNEYKNIKLFSPGICRKIRVSPARPAPRSAVLQVQPVFFVALQGLAQFAVLGHEAGAGVLVGVRCRNPDRPSARPVPPAGPGPGPSRPRPASGASPAVCGGRPVPAAPGPARGAAPCGAGSGPAPPRATWLRSRLALLQPVAVVLPGHRHRRAGPDRRRRSEAVHGGAQQVPVVGHQQHAARGIRPARAPGPRGCPRPGGLCRLVSSSRLGLRQTIRARARRAFSPPEKGATGWLTMSPPKPKPPGVFAVPAGTVLGAMRTKCCSGLSSGSSTSSCCWAK